MNIDNIIELYKSKVSPEIYSHTKIKLLKEELDIIHINVYHNYKDQWNLFIIEKELDQAVEYIVSGRIKQETWTGYNELVKYKWSVSAMDIFNDYMKQRIIDLLGDEKTLLDNESKRMEYQRKRRVKKSVKNGIYDRLPLETNEVEFGNPII